MSNIEETILEMNRLGGGGRPFLFIIDFEMLNPVVIEEEKTAASGIFYEFSRRSNLRDIVAPQAPSFFRRDPVPMTRYREGYDTVIHALKRGDSYLVNLTFPTRIETDLTLRGIFECARAKYRILFEDRFVCFSPETFVRIDQGVISSCPMKGTIDARLPAAEESLLADPKETAEHTTIVDLIRNDLNAVAVDVRVHRFRYLDHLRTNNKDLLQVSSEISGRLPDDYRHRIGSIIFSMLPAGSVTGAPKGKTLEIIRKAETGPRGYYTGIAGIFDGDTLDSCVLIRYIERSGGQIYYRSGGGITLGSDPDREYQELVDKVYVPLV